MTLETKSRVYFREFNKLFFDDKLINVKLELSEKLRSSAGVFYPAGKRDKFGTIRLNSAMLSLRSDKEIMETLLHEMTHAWLSFEQKRVKPHGIEFKQKIQEINKILSLNITTTHQYITWYRCDGICQEFEYCLYGYMSRVANPAVTEVSSRMHKLMCGGTFKETEKPRKEMLEAISKRYKQIKSNVKKTKKPRHADKQMPIFNHLRPVDYKIIEYGTTDDEA